MILPKCCRHRSFHWTLHCSFRSRGCCIRSRPRIGPSRANLCRSWHSSPRPPIQPCADPCAYCSTASSRPRLSLTETHTKSRHGSTPSQPTPRAHSTSFSTPSLPKQHARPTTGKGGRKEKKKEKPQLFCRLEKTGQLFATTQEGCKNLSALHTYLAQSPFLFLGPKVALPPAPFSALLLCAFDVHRQMAAKDPSNLAEIEHYLTKLVKTIARSTQLTPVYLRAAVAQHFSVAPARLDPLLQWLDCILAPKKDPATAAGDTLGSVFETLLASPGALLLSADAVNALADRVLATLELLPAGGDLHLYLVVNLVNLVTSVLHVISEYHEKVSRPALQRLLTLVEAVAVRHSLNGVDIVLHHPIFMKTLDRQGDHRPSTTVIRLGKKPPFSHLFIYLFICTTYSVFPCSTRPNGNANSASAATPTP